MNNEQTQAEKLAAEVAAKWSYVLPQRLRDNLHIHVSSAITQATAELREEVENEKQRFACLVDVNHDVATERDQAQSQVAALVRTIERSISLDHSGGPLVLKITFAGPVLYRIDVDTQATADAHDAKVRDVAEKEHKQWVFEILEYMRQYDPSGNGPNCTWEDLYSLFACELPATPNQQGEGV